jgi:hypothetical protein
MSVLAASSANTKLLVVTTRAYCHDISFTAVLSNERTFMDISLVVKGVPFMAVV